MYTTLRGVDERLVYLYVVVVEIVLKCKLTYVDKRLMFFWDMIFEP